MNREDIPASLIKKCAAGCKADIVFALNDKGRPMPIDVDPVAGGNVRLRWAFEGGTNLAFDMVESKLAFGPPRYHSGHFDTCTNAARFRKEPASPTRRTNPKKAGTHTKGTI